MENGLTGILQRAKNSKEKKERQEIIRTVLELGRELELIQTQLNYVVDSMLIDSIIYELMSKQKRYEYYLKRCKELGIVADGFAKIS